MPTLYTERSLVLQQARTLTTTRRAILRKQLSTNRTAYLVHSTGAYRGVMNASEWTALGAKVGGDTSIIVDAIAGHPRYRYYDGSATHDGKWGTSSEGGTRNPVVASEIDIPSYGDIGFHVNTAGRVFIGTTAEVGGTDALTVEGTSTFNDDAVFTGGGLTRYIGAIATDLKGVLTNTSTWDPGNMATDGSVVSTTITVTGAATGDVAYASLSSIGTNDVLVSAHVQAANTVRVVLMNKTGGALDIGSGTLRTLVWK